MCVGDHDGIDIVGVEADLAQTSAHLSIAQPDVDQHAAPTMHEERRIAAAAAPKDGQLSRNRGLLGGPGGQPWVLPKRQLGFRKRHSVDWAQDCGTQRSIEEQLGRHTLHIVSGDPVDLRQVLRCVDLSAEVHLRPRQL